MQIRNATSPTEVKGMTTAELRERFLVTDLFVDDELRAVYSHEDRVILVGVSPVTAPLTLESFPELQRAVGMYSSLGFNLLDEPLGNSRHHACTIWMLKEL